MKRFIPWHHHTLYGIQQPDGTFKPASSCWWQWGNRIFRHSLIVGDV